MWERGWQEDGYSHLKEGIAMFWGQNSMFTSGCRRVPNPRASEDVPERQQRGSLGPGSTSLAQVLGKDWVSI